MRPRSVRAAAALGAAVLVLAVACTKDAEPPAISTGTPKSPSELSWRRIASAPTKRQEVAVTVRDEKIYVIGGLLALGGATKAVEIYDPAIDRWSRGPELPIALHHAMAATYKGRVMVLGGFVADLGGAATDRVFVLTEGRWQEALSLSRPRGAGAAVAVDDQLVVVGGVSNGRHVGPVEVFDGTGWRDGAAIPSLRDHLAAASYGQRIYVSGGRRSGGHFGTFEVYDLTNDRWTAGPAMPTARSGHGAATVGTLIVTAGGEGPRMFPEVEGYDVETNGWISYPPMGVPRHGVGVAAVGLTVYTLVGGIEVGLEPSDASEALDLG